MATTAAPAPSPAAPLCTAVATLLHSDTGCLYSVGPSENLAFFLRVYILSYECTNI